MTTVTTGDLEPRIGDSKKKKKKGGGGSSL